MDNIDWKTIGVMAGVSLGVFVLGTIAMQTVGNPMIEKRQAAAKKKALEKKKATAEA